MKEQGQNAGKLGKFTISIKRVIASFNFMKYAQGLDAEVDEIVESIEENRNRLRIMFEQIGEDHGA